MYLNNSKTRKAGHTKAFKNPKTPVQKDVAFIIKYIAAPMNPIK